MTIKQLQIPAIYQVHYEEGAHDFLQVISLMCQIQSWGEQEVQFPRAVTSDALAFTVNMVWGLEICFPPLIIPEAFAVYFNATNCN